SGSLLLDDAERVRLFADGKRVLDDGVGNDCCCTPTVLECGRCASGLQPTPDTIKLVVSDIVSSGEFGLACVQIETANLDGEVTLTQAPVFSSDYWFDSHNWGTRDHPDLGNCVWRHVRPAL